MIRRVVPIFIFLTMFGGLFAANLPLPDMQQVVAQDRALAAAKQAHVGDWKAYLTRDTRTMDNYDVISYTINTQVDFSTHSITGVTTAVVNAVEDNVTSITFDFVDQMTVDGVLVNGNAATFTHENNQIVISLPAAVNTGTQITLATSYHGQPPADDFIGGGFYFVQHAGVDLAYSLVEPFAARAWWPCKDVTDDKANTVDLITTCPDNFTVASNGLLQSSVDNGDGTKTFHWHEGYPISTYLVMIALTNYQVFEQTYTAADGTVMPLQHFVLPEIYDQSVELLQNTPDYIALLASYFGPYPFIDEKYGHALAPGIGGAMEHETCTTIGSELMTPDYADVVVHELAHQWCGDMITCRDWANIWLNEGTAEYSEALYYESEYGTSVYHQFMNAIDTGASIDDKLERDPDASGSEVLDWVVYAKGAWTWHMLRHVMGETNFQQLLLNYFADPALRYGNADTENLCGHATAVMGEDMHWFFDEWFTQPGRPQYEYATYTNPDHNDFRVGILSTGNQGHTFNMPVPYQLDGIDGSVFVNGGLTHCTLTGTASTLTWDPDNWLLDNGYTEATPQLEQPNRDREGAVILLMPTWFDTGIRGFDVYRRTVGGEWQLLPNCPFVGTFYTDTTTTGDTDYEYCVSVVYTEAGVNYESSLSNTVSLSGTNFTFDQGILLVDQSYDYPTGMPSEAQQDAFYHLILDPYRVTEWDVASQGLPTLSEMGHYSTIVWYVDDITNTPFIHSTYNVECYLAAGGKMVVSAWKYLNSISSDAAATFFHYDDVNCSQTSNFIGAVPVGTLPALSVDASKVLMTAWNGRLPFTNVFPELNNAEALYTYDASDDAEGWEGATCGFRVPGSLYFFGFPLYYVDTTAAYHLMQAVMADLNEPAGVNDPTQPAVELQLSNAPNPFNPSTTIEFTLPQSAMVHLAVYDVRGRLVKTLVDSSRPVGTHRVQWDGRDANGHTVASGVYFVKLDASGYSMHRKMLLMK